MDWFCGEAESSKAAFGFDTLRQILWFYFCTWMFTSNYNFNWLDFEILHAQLAWKFLVGLSEDYLFWISGFYSWWVNYAS